MNLCGVNFILEIQQAYMLMYTSTVDASIQVSWNKALSNWADKVSNGHNVPFSYTTHKFIAANTQLLSHSLLARRIHHGRRVICTRPNILLERRVDHLKNGAVYSYSTFHRKWRISGNSDQLTLICRNYPRNVVLPSTSTPIMERGLAGHEGFSLAKTLLLQHWEHEQKVWRWRFKIHVRIRLHTVDTRTPHMHRNLREISWPDFF